MMLVFGVLGWIMEENGFPIAPAILGLVLGCDHLRGRSGIDRDGSRVGTTYC
jgi:hypothetical protein